MPRDEQPFSDDRDEDADLAGDAASWRKARMGQSGRFALLRFSNYVGLGTAVLVFGGVSSRGLRITSF